MTRHEPALLERLGKGLRRVQAADEGPDRTGFRTVWHHGPMKTDLFSFVGPERKLARQELVFLGQALSWDAEEGLATGRTDEGPSPAVPGSLQVRYDEGAPDPQILMQATVLLRSVPGEDFYALHLRKRVNEALAEVGVLRTDIRDLDPVFQAELRRLLDRVNTGQVPTGDAVEPIPARRGRAGVLLFALAGLVGIGAVLAWMLLP